MSGKTGTCKEAPDIWRVGRISWCGYGFACSRPDAMLMFIPQDFWIDPDTGNDMQTAQQRQGFFDEKIDLYQSFGVL
ncbi:hypothetical protein [Thiorhodospira sibirica]|uniref:hypothetical protein n=1 Tax=Thiorhodospira sibirica TaxID=154347 RepID=UPI001111E8DB|nr:hypothetical protein [Thiorhodospira sibirica]